MTRPVGSKYGPYNCKKTLEERFFEKVNKTDGCWLWTGFKNRLGYGDFYASYYKHMPAHRISWMIHNGEIKDKLHVLHRCDNPPCVNPEHLFLGTQRDNNHDRHKKGRTRTNPPIIDEFTHIKDRQLRYRLRKSKRKKEGSNS